MSLVLIGVLFAPTPARAAAPTLRLDPEVLSGRYAQYLLGESEIEVGTAAGGVKFGTNTRLSDEHIAGRLISQTEPAIAANPANSKNLVAGFHDLFPTGHDFVCRIAFTSDAGVTWTLGGATPLQASGNFCSDPALAADAQGNFYYAYLDINNGVQKSDVDVAKSTDGGRTFATFAVAASGNPNRNFPDKEFIGVDAWLGSPFQGTIYVSWTDFLNPLDRKALDNGQIKVVVSRDGGATWSEPVSISDSAKLETPYPKYSMLASSVRLIRASRTASSCCTPAPWRSRLNRSRPSRKLRSLCQSVSSASKAIRSSGRGITLLIQLIHDSVRRPDL